MTNTFNLHRVMLIISFILFFCLINPYILPQRIINNNIYSKQNIINNDDFIAAGTKIVEYDGFLYVTGEFNGNVLLLKYDTAGKLIWGQTWGVSNCHTEGISLTGYNEHIFVIGRLDEFSNAPEYNFNIDLILLKYDKAGNLHWNKTWGEGGSTNYANDIYLFSNYLYVIGSMDYIPILIKFDEDGNELWNRTWGGDYPYQGNPIEITAYNDTLFIIGVMNNWLRPRTGYMFLLNYDAEGYLLCNKTWTDVDLNLREGLLLSVDCTKLHNSTYISLTLSYETTPYMVCLLFRYDLDKQVLFLIRSYNDYELNRFESITGYDDNLFLIGQNLNGTVLIRMDAEGSQLWSYSLSYGNSKSMIASHNYLYIIESIESDKSRFDLSLLKFDTDGNLIWNKTWGGVGIYPLNQSAIISISMTKQQFYLDESLNVIISILNNGTANISCSRCCFTYILERNGTLIELFFPYNNTNEVILPGSVFTETIDLREYSSDIDTWEAIGNLGVGNYSLYAIYGCINNPWYNETDFPYNMSTSNVLQFEILENPVGNSNWTIVLIISTIILLTIVSSLVWLNRQRRQKT